MKRTILLLLAILLWGGTSLLHAQAEAPFLPSAADARCKQWVDSVFSGLNLQEKVGQLIVTTFPAKADKQKKKQIRDLVKKYKIGGLLFAEGTPEEQAILTNIAQKNSKVPVMITFDGEWGLSMRLEGTPYFPKNAALGCIEDNQLIYEYGREVAREFRELGVHVNFAPDADVNTNPLNPVIHVRSFGEDPKKVAEKVLAYSRGLESGGVLSVSKHFPGHGDTDVDSHKGLPVLYYNRERLDSVELYPFREMVRAGLGGVMVGHLQVPALEPDAKTASSLSRNVVTGLLKDEMGFQGLVFTDALDMKGVSSVPQLTTKALLAGNDMVLVQYNTANAVQEVLSAVKEGVLSEKEVEAKCRKILTYKYLLGLRQPRPQLQVSGMSYRIHPDIVIVDELAHTNVEGSRNEKRWQDVMDLLDEGINVISAVNIQHIESVNEEVQGISGIEVKERIPDSVLQEADEVVNIDLTAEELITRLKAGKIYKPEKVPMALNNFFKTENILQLRELALKEVALRVEKKVENEVVVSSVGVRHEKFLACISSKEKTPRRIIRKAARLATRYNTSFIALYVQTPRESADRIDLASQRYLLNHFKLVTELDGEVVQVQSKDVLDAIIRTCKERQITSVCMGSPSFRLPQSLFMVLKYRKFVNDLAQANVDLIILA